MTLMLRRMIMCHWSARRIQRYLDADPSGRLSPREARRLEAHLEVCEHCAPLLDEYQRLQRLLSRWSGQQVPEPAALVRLRAGLDRIVEEETG